MDLRHLECFLEVVKAGSLTAAASRCGVSQSALSQQMAALEGSLGEPLLVRKPRGVEPTAVGHALITTAGRILAARDEFLDSLADRRGLHGGTLVIGIIPTIAPYLLPRWVGPFRERHPRVSIRISEARTDVLLDELAAGGIEFAVMSDLTAAQRKRRGLVIDPLFEEPLLLATPAGHPLATRKSSPLPAELPADELIRLKFGHCLAEQTLRLCGIRDADSGLQCDQIETALAMVSSGLGISVVPKLAVAERDFPGIRLRPFGGGGMHRRVLLVRGGPRLSPAAAELCKSLMGNNFR